MTWKVKKKGILDNIKTRFAFYPVKIDDEWVWLEKYYIYKRFSWCTGSIIKYVFKTREDAEIHITNLIIGGT